MTYMACNNPIKRYNIEDYILWYIRNLSGGKKYMKIKVVLCLCMCVLAACSADKNYDNESFTVNFNTDGGRPRTISPVKIKSGSSMKEKYPGNPSKNGYQFRGWFDTTASPPEKYTETTIITKSVTLTASWALPKDFYNWAPTPPMGWNSYDAYGCNVTEEQVIANAEYIVENLIGLGYEYVVVDGRWFVENQTSGGLNTTDPIFVLDEYGRHTPAVNRFPSAADGAGFKPLADRLHNMGLKFGIHIMRGIPVKAVEDKLPIKNTDGITADKIYSTRDQCNWLADNYTIEAARSGAQEYYDSIFELYASWGVDYVKVDDISKPYHQPEIQLIRKSIDKTGRPMVLSLSPGKTPIDKAAHVKQYANMWRMIDDLWDRWGDIAELLDVTGQWESHIGPGHWPDADMLPFGVINITGHNGRAPSRLPQLSNDEIYSEMTLHTIVRSPLMFGGDLPETHERDKFSLSLITNEETLYITKKSENNRQLYNTRDTVAWIADDSENDDKFLALFYCGSARPGQGQLGSVEPGVVESRVFSVDLAEMGFTGKVKVRDLWQKRDIGEFSGSEFAPEIAFHGAGLYRLSPVQ